MKKTLTAILAVIALTLTLLVGGAFGYLYYRDNHVFVEGIAYPARAQTLDLRGRQITFAHYDQLHSLLPECHICWDVPIQGRKYPSTTWELTLERVSQTDLNILKTYFPDLITLNVPNCQEYALLEEFQAMRPECKVVYTVNIGPTAVNPAVQTLELSEGSYDLATLEQNLPHLREITGIHFPKSTLTWQEIQALRLRWPDCAITYTVELMGQEYDPDTTTALDLSQITPEEVPQAVQQLAALPNVTSIELMGGETPLSKEEARALTLAAPQAQFHYSFDFYGETLSSSDQEVHLKNLKIGDEGEQEIRLALDLLPNCERFILESCGVSNEVMAQLREDYRGRTKVVWRVHFGKGGGSLTDATAIRVVGGLLDDNCADLIYCEDTVYMDIGHNEYLDGVPFIAGMPNLEYVIISGAPVKSLEPFRVCKKLKFLEAAFCEYIYDGSPLADCESLEMLNISYTHITDLSPLDNLEHLNTLCVKYYPRARVSYEEQQRFDQLHPDCLTQYVGSQPYGEGWRYAKDQSYLPDYQLIRRVFNYDASPGPGCPNNTGFYYEDVLGNL